MRLKHLKDYSLFLTLSLSFFWIVKPQISRGSESADSWIVLSRCIVAACTCPHMDTQTQARLFRGVRVHAPLLVAIQTPFFVIYDNTYAVGRITTRRRRSGFV